MLDEIDFGELKKPTAKVAVCQIALSENQIASSGKTLDADTLASIWRRINRTLGEVIAEKPDVILFPECSIPEALLKKLQDFSQKNDVIIIAGTHYVSTAEGFISRCPVIFPDGKLHPTEKITVSPLERKPIRGQSVISGASRILFKNTRIGDFLVYICSDFLDTNTQAEIEDLDPDLVFVPAFHPTSSKHYYNELHTACGVGLNGCYCLYSNVKSPKISDGGSAIFGITDNLYQSAYSESGLSDLNPPTKVWQAKSENDYVIAELDLELRKPEAPKRVSTKPNIDIIADRSRLRTRKTLYDQTKEYKLAVFDMDGTLVRGILFSWVKLWELCGDDGTLWKDYLSKYRTGRLEYDAWCDIAVDYYRKAGLSKDVIFDVAREQAYIVSGLEEGMLELKSMGFHTALVSGGVDIFMMALMPNYRSLFDHNFINRLHFDGEDIVSGVEHTRYDYDGKAKAIDWLCSYYGYDVDESIFVGDAYNDDAALKHAGYSIVFGASEDGVKHVSNKVIEGENFRDVVNHIKQINQNNFSGI